MPDDPDKLPWTGHIGTHLLDKVISIVKQSSATLIFTNTRSFAEIWYQRMLDKAPTGVIKESLAVGALLFISGVYLGAVSAARQKWWEYLSGLVAIVFLWKLKYYWTALLIPSALTTTIIIGGMRWVRSELRPLWKVSLWFLLFSIITLFLSRLHPNFYLEHLLKVIVENHNAYLVSAERPFVQFYELQPTWSSVFQNSPWALFSGIFRPFVTESRTVFQLIVALENAVILLLLLYSIWYMMTYRISINRLLLLSMVVYICLLAIFLTLSTPNFGTLSRYRIGYTPFLFFLLLYLPWQQFLRYRLNLKQS